MNADVLNATGTMRPRVWGIGLTRTGTTSLNRALQILGYESIHWPTIGALLYGDLEAATDESVAVVYRFLDARYPGSKFILTQRRETDWLASTAKHRAHLAGNISEFLDRRLQDLHPAQKDRWVEIQFTQMMLYGTLRFETERFLAGYRQHYRGVSEYFAGRSSDLLRLRICDGDGWEQLCPFLGETVISEPFPFENAAPSNSVRN